MNWLQSLGGGVLIGLAVTWMLLFTGRVTGISGIIESTLSRKENSWWRPLFLLGLFFGGLILNFQDSDFFSNTTDRSLPIIIGAGLLVGIGTACANGCTSGHGICGLSRLSKRSMAATMTFMLFGALTVFIYVRFS
jgi:uncharacterized protein